MPVCLLLVVLPQWGWSRRLATFVVSLLLAPLYGYLLMHAPTIPGGGFASLAQVSRLFALPEIHLGIWVHYLDDDFSLAPGRHEMPCGPLDLLIYLLFRFILRKQLSAALGT